MITDAARTRPAGRIVVIDGLRLVAALMVALYHYTAIDAGVTAAWGSRPAAVFPGLSRLTSYGWLGVELFFMISGFVICLSCWGRTPGDFFRSRITRLFPAYWPAVLITAAVVTLWPIAGPRPGLSGVIVNLTMLHEPLRVRTVDGVYWTLWAEARFYLLFALVVWHGLTRRTVTLFCYGWLVAHAITVSTHQPALLRVVFQPDFAPFFIAGVGFYLIHRFGPDITLWGIIGIAYAVAQHNTMARVATVSANNVRHALTPALGALLVTAYFAVLAAVALGWLSRIRWRWLTTAGALTYPFYLLHETIGWTIIHALRGAAPHYVIVTAVLAIMLVAAWLLHRLIEKPLARFLRSQLELASARSRSHDPAPPSRPIVTPRPEPVPSSVTAPNS